MTSKNSITYIPKNIEKHIHEYEEKYTLVINNVNKKASGSNYNTHEYYNVIKCKYCDSFMAQSETYNYSGHIFNKKDIDEKLPIIYAETNYKDPLYNFNDLENVLVTKLSYNDVFYSIVKKDNNIDEKEYSLLILKKLSKYLNIKYSEFYYNEYGKPFFKENVFYFNYSHSDNYLACAISLFDVGIDIEDTTRVINDNLNNRYLDHERENNKKLEKWVRKESYSKLKGLGLQMDFSKIDLDSINNKYHLIKTNDYICSIYSDSKNPHYKSINLIEDTN